MVINLIHLRAFHAVASEGNFSRAVAAINTSQPSLSKQVITLEKRYGVRLFHRHHKGVKLTETGKTIFESAQRIFDAEQEIEETLTATSDLLGGRIKIGADGPRHVVPLIAEFKRRHPQVEIKITMGNARKVLADLLECKTDVAITGAQTDDRRLWTLPFINSAIIAFVSKDHPWAKESTISMEDFSGQNLVIREPNSLTREIFDAAMRRANVTPKQIMEINTRDAIREIVAAGFGVGIMTELEYYESPLTVPLHIEGVNLRMYEQVACLEERRKLKVVRGFIDLAEEFAQH